MDTAHAGMAVACPHCNGQFEVPGPPEGAAPRQPVAPAQAPQLRTVQTPPQQQQYVPPQQQPQQPPPQQQGYAPPPQQQPPGYPPRQMPPGGARPGMPGYPGFGKVGFGEVLMDPLESQPRFVETGGLKRAAGWGWSLMGLCVLVIWLAMWRNTVAMVESMGIGEAKFELSDHLQMMLIGAIPVLVYFVLLIVLNAMRGNQAKLGAVAFTAGVASLPMTVFSAFMILFMMSDAWKGIDNIGQLETAMHVIVILITFLLCATVLLTKASLVSILGFSRKGAFWLVPTLLVVSVYVSQLLLKLVAKSAA